MHASKRKRILLAVLLGLLVVGFWLSLLHGPAGAGWNEFLSRVAGKDPAYIKILLYIRLPRALLAFFVGASLALSGAILQGYFQNPMAGPFVVGVSSGASLGAVISIFLGLNTFVLGFSIQSVFAFLSGFLLVSAVYLISQKSASSQVETLLLTGIAAGAMASSLTSFLIFLKADAFEQAVFWLLGSFSLADWKQVAAVWPYFLIGLVISIWMSKDMNLLAMGDETAQALGCQVRRTRRIFLVLSTLLAAAAVSVSGIIGFVGLIVPHWVRLLIGPDHRALFLFSSLAGGLFLVYSDFLARTLLPATELPIGVITATVGAPLFIYLLYKKRET